MVWVLVASTGGIAGYIYLKKNNKKDTKKSGPDSDADYIDEEDVFLSDLPEDDFKEEIGDIDIIEKYDEE